MANAIQVLALAGFGAALQELLHWYGLRTHLNQKKYQRTLRSKSYWLFTISFVASAAILALIWFDDRPTHQKIDVVFFGLSLPLILKRAYTAFGSELRLGEDVGGYFGR